MEFVNVKTQAALDKALQQDNVIPVVVGNGIFEIRSGSPEIHIKGSSSPSMVARESSSPRMVARESSSPSMVAWDSSSPSMVARESSSPSMVARESSSPSMVARGSSSPSMEARESSSPRMVARESSSPSMVARDSSSVTGSVSKYSLVAVLRHDRAKVDLPGAVILRTPEEITTLDDWIDYYGLKCKGTQLTVYKLVGDDLISSHGTLYEIGMSVSCADFSLEAVCGNGLHFSPSPSATHKYASGTRYVACQVRKKDVVLLGDKIKAKACKVLYEVNLDGEKVEPTAVAA